MINRRHKDTVFRDLFGNEERKENALELYNAVNGTDHGDPDDITITTLDDVIYMGAKNDVSFIVDDEMALWEHQSTVNPNMPLRGLIYFAKLYSSWIEREGRSLYSSATVRIPVPRYVVFYNGLDERPDAEELRLSDAFHKRDVPGDLEVTAHVVNVNDGRNSAIMERSGTLAGYAYLVGLIREYGEAMEPDEAVGRAVARCIREGVLAEYLSEKRAEVLEMLLTEYDEEKVMAMLRDEWRAAAMKEGREAGLKAGREEGLKAGREEGLKAGREEGLKAGRETGREEGREEGLREGREAALARAHADTLGRVAVLVSEGSLEMGAAVRAFGFTEDEVRAAMAARD